MDRIGGYVLFEEDTLSNQIISEFRSSVRCRAEYIELCFFLSTKRAQCGLPLRVRNDDEGNRRRCMCGLWKFTREPCYTVERGYCLVLYNREPRSLNDGLLN